MRPPIRVVAVALTLTTLLSTSCSVAFQDSVRSSGTACSTSRFWYVSDILLAGGLAAVVASQDGEAAGYVPTGVFALSAVYGIYKRGNCVRHQERASPEQWARDSARERRKEQARADAMSTMVSRMNQPPPPAYVTPAGPPPAPRRDPVADTRPRSTPTADPGITVTHVVHQAADELGKSCRSHSPELPTQGSCKYGALCYRERCTLNCKVDADCPAPTTCRYSDGPTKWKICR